MAVTSTDIANEAINLMGDNQAPVTGVAPTFDNSAAGLALQKIYASVVATVGRQFGWDFARGSVSLTLTGNAAALGYAYEYFYPTNGVEIWELMPSSLADPNNPLPTTFNVGNNLVASVQTKVIWTSVQNAQAIYNNNPSESTWDPGFRMAVVRLLASELAYAIGGRPDTGQSMLDSASSFEGAGEGRPN